jgi:hypothetical protein
MLLLTQALGRAIAQAVRHYLHSGIARLYSREILGIIGGRSDTVAQCHLVCRFALQLQLDQSIILLPHGAGTTGSSSPHT